MYISILALVLSGCDATLHTRVAPGNRYTERVRSICSNLDSQLAVISRYTVATGNLESIGNQLKKGTGEATDLLDTAIYQVQSLSPPPHEQRHASSLLRALKASANGFVELAHDLRKSYGSSFEDIGGRKLHLYVSLNLTILHACQQ
jgi:hypothetical protein